MRVFYYPKSGLVMVGATLHVLLFSSSASVMAAMRHDPHRTMMIATAIGALSSAPFLFLNMHICRNLFANFAVEKEELVLWTISSCCHAQAVRVQRWFRRRLFERRALALAMALHPRLGAGSALGKLGEDPLSLIIILRGGGAAAARHA